MNEETLEYNGYVIVKQGEAFFVRAPDLFTGLMYQRNLEEAQKFINYIIAHREEWVC